MISLHAYDAQDFSGHGISALFPTVCDVKEAALGLYELELTHPITDDGRALSIGTGMLIKAPVPARETPLITNFHEGNAGQPGHVIYETNITTEGSGGYVRIYTKASAGSKILQKLRNHVEFIYHGDHNANWVKGTSAEGTTGYLYKDNVRYVRTEPDVPGTPGYNTVVMPRQIREQLFRVYDLAVDTETNTVKVLARHVFYDQAKNFVKTYNPKDVPLPAALEAMSADLINEHDFNYYTNITRTISAEWALKNGVSTIQDPDEGAASKLKAQVVRDNFDTFLLEDTEIDRGVVIEAGKNLLGVKSKVNDENVVTRIMPYGTDKAGKMLLLPEVYLDSQYIYNYPNVCSIPLPVQDAVEKDASGSDPGMTKEQAFKKMRQAAQEKFDAGCDLPDFDFQVNFIQLGDTVEYAAYKDLLQVFLHDTVTVKHGRLGMLYKIKVVGYDFDAALGRYNGVTLGSIKNGAELGAIAGFQLPNGGISGMKLVPGSVGSGQLRELSVLAAHIGLAQIVNAHIQDATIDKAKVKDFVAEVAAIAVAKIGDAWIDTAWIGKLTAEVVDIVTANIGTLLANSATIQWAQIANLTAAVADITLAKIQTANIGWAQITGLAAETALFTQGVSGQLYCASLMVTDGNIESLSANKIAGGMATFGKLMLMGQDGKLYEINVGSLGEVTASEKKLDDENVGDYVLVDRNIASGTVTARTLNVQDIFANSILVRQLISQNIDTDTLFANSAYTNKLRTHLIESDIGGMLKIVGGTGVAISVADAVANAVATAGDAQTTAVAAQTAANTANAKLADIAADNKLTPIEKQDAKKEWDIIAGEKTRIDAQADVYGRSKTAYGMAYAALDGYLNASGTGLLTNMSTTSDISGAYYRLIFTEYYNNRQSLLNDIAYRAKSLADTAQSTADGVAADLTVLSNAITAQILAVINGTYQKIAGITLDETGFDVEGKQMTVRDVSGSDPTFIVDTINKYIKVMNASLGGLALYGDLTGPNNVMTRITSEGVSLYPGANNMETIDNTPRYAYNNLTFFFATGTYYETLSWLGFHGRGKIILFIQPGVTIKGGIALRNNANIFLVDGYTLGEANIIADGDLGSIVYIENSTVEIKKMRLTGKPRANDSEGTSNGVNITDNANVILNDCIIERTNTAAVRVDRQSTVTVYNCRGGQSGDYATLANKYGGVLALGNSTVMVGGTGIIGNSFNHQNWDGHPISGIITPTASPGVYTPPTQVHERYVCNSTKWCDLPATANMNTNSSGWSVTDPRGGWRQDKNLRYSGMWLLQREGGSVEDIRTRKIGKTIIGATLRVHCVDCWAGSTAHDLYYMTVGTVAAAGDSPGSRLVDTGLDITLINGSDTVIDVTVFVQGRIAAGDDFYGFGLGLAGKYVLMDSVCILDIVYQ